MFSPSHVLREEKVWIKRLLGHRELQERPWFPHWLSSWMWATYSSYSALYLSSKQGWEWFAFLDDCKEKSIYHKNAIECTCHRICETDEARRSAGCTGGCKCSLAHHRSSRMMPLKCARGGVFSFPKQASSACGVLVSLAREPSMRTLCSVVFPPACSPWWLPGFKSSICHVLALCLRAIILTLLSLSLHISKGTCKKWVQ